MQIKPYQLLEDYKAEHVERAEKLSQYQKDAEAARARLNELQTQYEHTFTTSVKEGKDATAELDKIDQDIEVQREVVARRERDYKLAYQAMPDTKISPVDVVARYKPDYADGVRKEFEDLVNPKLMLARDLVISAIVDGKEYARAHQSLHEEIEKLVKGNHQRGLTNAIMYQNHPTNNAQIHKTVGTLSGVRRLWEEISQFTFDKTPDDYTYVAVAPTVVAPKTTAKEGK